MEEYLLSQLDTPVVLNRRSSESRAKPRLSYAESRRKWAKAKDGTMMTFELSRQTGLRRTPSFARLSTYGAQEAKGQKTTTNLTN